MSDFEDDNGSDGEEQQPKGNMFLQQAAMKSKMNLDDQKKFTCQGCKKDVWPNQEKTMPVKDQYYHAECFKCEVCKSRLMNGKFSALKGHYYCVPHYTEMLKAAGGKVDAVVGIDRNKIEQAREAARATATGRVAGIKAAEDQSRGNNWQAAKTTAKASDAAGRAEVAKSQSDDRKASDRANNATSASGQAIRAKFAPPKPSFERTSVGDAPAPKPVAKSSFKAPAPAPAAKAAPSGGVSAAASKFSAPAPAAKAAPPAKPAAKAAPPPGRAAVSPSGRAASPGAARAGFKAPTPKFEVDEEEQRRKDEEERQRKLEEEAAAEAAAKSREEEEARQRDEEEARVRREEEEARQREEEERQRAEEEERQRQEAEASAQQEYPQDEAPPAEEEAPPAEEYQENTEFQPVVGKKWERIEHEDGDVYFYNHETGESLWEQPEDYDG